jgi:hypothetical protein
MRITFAFFPPSDVDRSLMASFDRINDAIRAAGMTAKWAEEGAVSMAGAVIDDTAHATAVALPGSSLALHVF